MTDFDAILKEAEDPSTASTRLKDIYYKFSYTYGKVTLSTEEVRQLGTAILLNPNTPADVLFRDKTNWEIVKQNPATPLLQLEDPKYLLKGTVTFRWVKKYKQGHIVETYTFNQRTDEIMLTFPEYIIVFGDGEVLSYDAATFRKFYAYSDLDEWSSSVDETGDTTWWTLLRKYSDQGRLKRITRSQFK